MTNTIYVDSNIFLNALLYDDKRAKKCKELLKEIGKKEKNGVTAILTWDEVVYVTKKFLGVEIGNSEGKKFLGLPNISLKKVDKEIIEKAQKIIETYNVGPRDAIHAATALVNNIKEIASDDSDFDKIKELKRIKP